MGYLLDADVFIQAKNLHYGFDFCPAFWDWLIQKHTEGEVFSIEKVRGDLAAGSDGLAEWAKTRGDAFFLRPDSRVLSSFEAVSSWVVDSGRYEQSAINTFLQVSDYYLISHAHAHKHTVVTHEVPAQSRKKIKIPDVCIGLAIPVVSPFEMLRREHARFVLP